ncbi:hypothetical protein GOBAR_DD28474 [Gossypium barbadense]|nr:hypothetical protein GOBAR_DD28474 [Gossypium barbadense]
MFQLIAFFDVDLVKRHCFPVYWNGETRRVLRGHWFARKGGMDWLPLREDVAEQLEIAYRSQVWHRRKFQPSGLFAARVDLQGSTPGLHALFTGEDDTWEAWLNVDASGFSGVISFSRNGIKLRRGYSASQSPKPTQDELRQRKEEQMDDYCSQVPVRHLVFMVHGIGQRLEKSNLVDDVGNFRHITASLAERHLTSHQRRKQRVLFIPCQVSNQLNRLYLKFLKRNPGYDGKCLYEKDSKDLECSPDMIDQSFECSSLANIEKNDSTMMTKDIVDCLGEEILLPNPSVIEGHVEDKSSVSTKFDVAAEDPMQKSCREDVHQSLNDFSGAPWLEESGSGETTEVDFVVSDGCWEKATEEENEEARDRDKTIKMLKEEIDSLKAKIAELESNNSEDIGENKEMLMQKPPMLQKFDQKLPLKLEDATKSYTPYIRYTKLEFKVDTFFAVGSPLGVFLALRNIRIGLGKGQDYWDEENISEEMPACRQMFNIFHPFDPVAYRVEPLVCKEYITKRPVIIPYHKGGKRLHIGFQEFTERLAARSHVVMDHFSTVRAKVLTACQSRDTDNLEGEENVKEKEETSYGSLMIERLTGSEGRIDHVLQDKTFEHPYLQAIGSHT